VIKLSISDFISILSMNVLFKGFSSEELLLVFRSGQYTISKYNKEGMIHLEDQKCLTFDIILKGKITIQDIDEKGNTLIITEFTAGDNIGGNLVFSKYPYYPMNVIARTDAVILHIEKALVLQLCQQNKDFLTEFLSCISEKTSILTSKIKAITMKSIRECIVDFLSHEFYAQKNNCIKLSLTKKEIAQRIGIQRTSLSRELNKMRNEGLITYDANTVTIQNPDIIKKR
jgi:CRP/FNR family transcriptional regulator, dissimilatory nitrate respiration regulator